MSFHLYLFQEEKLLKEKSKQDLIDDLMFSDTDASEIIAKHAATASKAPSNVSKILEESRNAVSNGIKIVPTVEGQPYIHTEMVLDLNGPSPPTEEEVKSSRFVSHVRKLEDFERAAGFSEDVACLRSLQDAMSGLYYSAGNTDR
jgi:hypothetical protein